jgi:hypothetical protein
LANIAPALNRVFLDSLYAALKGRSSTVAPLTRRNDTAGGGSTPPRENRARRGPRAVPHDPLAAKRRERFRRHVFAQILRLRLRISPGGPERLKLSHFAVPMTIFVDRSSPFAYNSQSTTESGIGGAPPRKGQQPCGLWPTVWVPASAASGGLKRWEKLSFRAEHLPPPPECGEEVCLRPKAASSWQLAI